MKKIATESDTNSVMAEVSRLMVNGSSNVTKTELSNIRKRAMAPQE
ncbi:MAG: hypothetical protein ABI707_04185 [Ferruginibacter sp.]